MLIQNLKTYKTIFGHKITINMSFAQWNSLSNINYIQNQNYPSMRFWKKMNFQGSNQLEKTSMRWILSFLKFLIKHSEPNQGFKSLTMIILKLFLKKCREGHKKAIYRRMIQLQVFHIKNWGRKLQSIYLKKSVSEK